MKKKIVVLVIALLLVVLGVYTGFRFARRGTDIIGVTTLNGKNTVILNAKTGDEFASGTGYLTVGEGERIHLEHNLSSGSLSVAFKSGEGAAEALANLDLDNLPSAADMTGEGAFGKEDISGKGSLDFEAEPGEYTVHFTNNSAVGTARVTAKK